MDNPKSTVNSEKNNPARRTVSFSTIGRKFFSGRSLLLAGLILVILVGVFIPTHFTHAGWWDTLTDPASMVDGIATVFAQGLLYLMSWITGIAGLLLNYVLKYTIVDMKTHLAGLTGINTAWKVIRDIMNIGFIFLLVYEGILMIIGQSSVEKVRKFIVAIVIASLLVNFSLFFTKVLIDASNIVTIGVYNSLLPPNPQPTDLNYGLSNAFTSKLQITSLYSTKAGSDLGGQKGFGGIIIFTVGSAIILLVSAFVFFAIACMFVIRYITLIILLMLSPIAYMGSVIPGFGTYSKQWWESLKGQLLFAPIYMIMTSVILTLMGSSDFLVRADFANVLANNGGTLPTQEILGLILNFAVIIGLLIASLVIAKSSSTQGSKLIGQATGKLTAFAGGAVMGSTARLGRNTVGRWGNAAANDEDLKKRAAEGDVGARMKLATANRFAKGSFDVRSTGKFQDLSKTTGVDFGKVDSKKENFKAIKETQAKAAEEKAKQYKPSDLAVQQAKARLDTNTDEGIKFADEEAEKKRAHDIYIQSDDYKNSTEYKKERQLEDDNRRDAFKIRNNETEIKSSKDKIEGLRKEMTSDVDKLKKQLEDLDREEKTSGKPGLNVGKKAAINDRIKALESDSDYNVKKARISEQISEMERDTARKEDLLKELKNLVKDRGEYLKKAELDRKLWMSEEKKLLVATSGGQKEKKDDQGNITQQEIKSAFEQRAEAVASRIENTGPMWRYVANTVGTVANVVGVPYVSIPKTKADRQELARRVRKATNPKTAAQLRKEADKKDKEEAAARGDKPDEDEDNEPKVTPATTTPATDTTTPNTT